MASQATPYCLCSYSRIWYKYSKEFITFIFPISHSKALFPNPSCVKNLFTSKISLRSRSRTKTKNPLALNGKLGRYNRYNLPLRHTPCIPTPSRTSINTRLLCVSNLVLARRGIALHACTAGVALDCCCCAVLFVCELDGGRAGGKGEGGRETYHAVIHDASPLQPSEQATC